MSSALIGFGNWGKKIYDTLQTQENIKYVYTRSGVNIPNGTNDLVKILEDASVKNVFIATPIKTHFEIVEKFLLAKKNVFCEKVLCTTVDEHLYLEELASKNDAKLFVGYINLYNDSYKQLKQILSQKKVTKLEIVWEKYGTFTEDINLNLTSHILSILLVLFGECREVTDIKTKAGISSCDFIQFKTNFDELDNISVTINRLSEETRLTYTLHTPEESINWNPTSPNNSSLNSTPLHNEIKSFLYNKKSNHNLSISRSVTSILEKFFN